MNRNLKLQRTMERKVLNITLKDRVKNTEIWKQTQVKDIRKIKESKWSWAGHSARRDDHRWTKIEAHRVATKNRKEISAGTGRNVDGEMTSHSTQAGNNWTRLAQNRQKSEKHVGGSMYLASSNRIMETAGC